MMLFSLAYLDSSDTSKGPEITITDPRILCLDLLKESSRNIQSVIGTVQRLGFEPHGGIIAMKIICKERFAHIELTHLPPVPVALSYVPELCQAKRTRTGPYEPSMCNLVFVST